MAPRRKFNRGRGRGGGGRGRGGGAHRPHQDNRVGFQDIVKKNEKFERFYNTLGIVPAGPERDAFWATLRRELPNSFRFTGSKGHALSVRNNLVERFFPLISQIKHEGQPVEIPKEIPWYPEGLAYSMTTPKNVVRKYEPFKEFQKFLVSETGVGNISRQEHVSMIPPLLLDVRPEHTVLDLCAAPGSKSAQLLEAIHAGEEERVEKAVKAAKSPGNLSQAEQNGMPMYDSGRTTGLLVANDVNYQRAQMLIHQVKRLNSPNLIVTNHDATMFPSIELPTPPPLPGQQKKGKYLKFDRILADVPCSGDGTCRKNPAIWKDWSPQNGLGLYITQVRILTRALQMLKLGGRVVYSTCSMNPVENEAVVASAIERCGGVAKVRLLDCGDTLPALIRNKGLTDWSIMSRSGHIYESYAEAEQYESEDSKLVPGMFAPDSDEYIPLQHCMRVYPHQQDTGGFFIAVLEKLSEIRAKPEVESKSMKKDWKFTAPDTATVSASTTMVGELLEEIEHPQPPVRSDGDMSSAAARQNSDTGLDTIAGAKRKVLEDQETEEESAAKKAKVGNGLDDDDIAAENATRQEHWPPPPAVELAIEAAGTDPGSEIMQNGAADDASVSTPNELQPLPRKRRKDNEPANEEAFKYLSPTHPELESIYKFYELHEDFPRDRFLVRNPAGDPVKGIYYSSQLAKDILTTNEGRGMKFVHGGVKMFMKQDSQGQDICRWRIQTEGLPIIEGWVGEARVIRMSKKATLRKLLLEMFPKIKEGPDGKGGWKELGEIGEQVLNIGMGCCVLRVEATADEDGFEEALTLPLWRSLHSLNLMLPKEDRKAMLLRIFNEDTELINHSDSKAGSKTSKGDEKEAKGSIPAENDAKELEQRIANDDSTVPEIEVLRDNGLAADQDELAEEDAERAKALEEMEDEGKKLEDAMPERWDESDEANVTV